MVNANFLTNGYVSLKTQIHTHPPGQQSKVALCVFVQLTVLM